MGNLPVICLRGEVFFPGMVTYIPFGRNISKNAILSVEQTQSSFLLITQKNENAETPNQEDLYSIGTICRLLQPLKVEGNTIFGLICGDQAGRLLSVRQENFLSGQVEVIKSWHNKESLEDYKSSGEEIFNLARPFLTHDPGLISILQTFLSEPEQSELNNFCTLVANALFDVEKKQKLLEIQEIPEAIAFIKNTIKTKG